MEVYSKQKLWIVLILAVSLMVGNVSSDQQEQECPEECICEVNLETFETTVNCAQLELTQVPASMPKHVTIFDMSGCNIPVLDKGVFNLSANNFESMLELNMRDCNISIINEHAFESFNSLKNLYLSGNNIVTLTTEMLPDSLALLDLEGNQMDCKYLRETLEAERPSLRLLCESRQDSDSNACTSEEEVKQECPDGCSCEFDTNQQEVTVDCSYQEVSSVPLRLPKCTTFLDMSNCLIQTLNESSFHRPGGNYDSLVELNLKQCLIRGLDNNPFYHLPNLRKLDLSYNYISNLTHVKFPENLRVLDLDNNEIDCQSIKERLVQTYPRLRTVCRVGKTPVKIERACPTPEEVLADCPKNCSCGTHENAGEVFVDCSYTGLTEAPQRLPRCTTHLDLNGCQLKELTKRTFRRPGSNYDAIHILSLKYCHISKITKKAFLHLPNLKNIDLSYNDLRKVAPGQFPVGLRLLDLQNNRINCAAVKETFRTSHATLKVLCSARQSYDWFPVAEDFDLSTFLNFLIISIAAIISNFSVWMTRNIGEEPDILHLEVTFAFFAALASVVALWVYSILLLKQIRKPDIVPRGILVVCTIIAVVGGFLFSVVKCHHRRPAGSSDMKFMRVCSMLAIIGVSVFGLVTLFTDSIE